MGTNDPAFTVHVMNPRHKTGAKKSTKKKSSKKKSAKKVTRRRMTSAKVTTTGTAYAVGKKKTMARRRKKATRRRRSARRAAPTRTITRRRRRNPTPPKRRRRRSNPSMRGGLTAVVSEFQNSLPRLMGKLAAAWAVRRWSSSPGGMFGVAHTSPTAGEGWSFPQYLIAGAVALWGPPLVSRFLNASEFRRGVVDLMAEKLVWTELIARNSWAVQQFGTGDVGINNSTGQAWVNQNNRWNAMQGLVEQTPLDGLVEQTALDGPNDYQYGQLLPSNTSIGVQRAGKWSGSGYTSPYHAAYS